MSNLINKHIFKYLNKINNDEDSEFNENFEKLQKIASINLEDVNFDKFINLLKYVHFILDNSVFKNPEIFHQIHIHFQIDNDELEDVIASYLVIYYNMKLRNSDVGSEENDFFLELKSKLNVIFPKNRNV